MSGSFRPTDSAPPKPVLIKLGGSLINQENKQLLGDLGRIIRRCSATRPLVIVPGGGPFADCVRFYTNKLHILDPTAHFMALLAMDQVALLLQQFIPGSRLQDISDPGNLSRIVSPEPHILLCSRYLSRIPSEQLPRSWDVTSDSIAALLAGHLRAEFLILLKSTDIHPDVKEPDVDRYFHQALPPDLPVWILNGLFPGRLSELLESGETKGLFLPPRVRSVSEIRSPWL